MKNKLKKLKDEKLFMYFLAAFVIFALILAIYMDNKHQDVIIVQNDDVVMYYFYLNTCPHCKEQEEFHNTLKLKFPNLKIIEYEMTKSDSREKYLQITSNLTGFDNTKISTPTTIIGNQYNVGYISDAITGQKLINMIEQEIEKHTLNNENDCKQQEEQFN